MKNWLTRTAMPVIIAATLAGLAGPAVAAPNPPGPVDTEPFLVPCPGGKTLTTVLSGKAKLLELPGGRLKAVSPNQRVTFTGPAGQETYVITGTTHVQNLSDGVQEFRSTGRNVILVPQVDGPNGHPAGVFATKGNVNFALQNGDELRLFSGTGQVTDVCALLAP